MTLAAYPVANKTAERYVRDVHRHLPSVHHRMWSIGAYDGSSLVGVAIVGRPTARLLCETPLKTMEVVRVATNGYPNACSMLYAACARAARGMGALSLLTYTLESEPGTSLRAAGWLKDPGFFGGGQFNRPSRRRSERSGVVSDRKARWWAPWSARRSGGGNDN